MFKSTTIQDIEAFIRDFEACSLQKSRWTHHAHLLVGLWYLSRHSPDEALLIVRQRIHAYNEAVGTANSETSGYHETLTHLFLRGIAAHISAHSREPLPESLAQLLDSPLASKNWPLTFYSRERLFSITARRQWLEPDLAPLKSNDVFNHALRGSSPSSHNPLLERIVKVGANMVVCSALTSKDVVAAGTLFREYADWLEIDLSFQEFNREMANLPGDYTPPLGRLLLAWADSEPAGCVALRPMNDSVCEMKRLFVRPTFRGQSVGRMLAEAVIVEAKAIGYSSMRLDTLPRMTAAIRLYDSLGFIAIPAYYDTPLADTIFMARVL